MQHCCISELDYLKKDFWLEGKMMWNMRNYLLETATIKLEGRR
jgi:hypothetical protein